MTLSVQMLFLSDLLFIHFLFIHCPPEINNIGQFKTIDDFLGNHIYLEENNNTIKPETAFWAHCSNLQTWAENSYDTGILDSRLAFPLLKRLTEVGDKTAEKVFKQEIIKGMMSENFNRILLLVENSYLDYLTTKDLKFITSKYKLFDFILNEIREKKENIITFVGKLPTFDKYYSLLFYRPIKKKIRHEK